MSKNYIIYVAGKYSGESEEEVVSNIKAAEEMGILLLSKGFIPIIPHRISAHWENRKEFEHWKPEDWVNRFCIPLISVCDALLFLENWKHSFGANVELGYALRNKIPCYFSIDNVILNML